jgi:hypothetical protein
MLLISVSLPRTANGILKFFYRCIFAVFVTEPRVNTSLRLFNKKENSWLNVQLAFYPTLPDEEERDVLVTIIFYFPI